MFQCPAQLLSRSSTDVHTHCMSSAQIILNWNDSSYSIPPKYLLDERSYLSNLILRVSLPKLLLANSKYRNTHFKIKHQGLEAGPCCDAVNALQPINTAERVTTAMQPPVCPDSALSEPRQSHLSSPLTQDHSCHAGMGRFQLVNEPCGMDEGF